MTSPSTPHPVGQPASRVLIVDDSRTMRLIIRRGLTLAGVASEDIAEACNGREAIDRLAGFEPTLIVSDVNMPVLDGVGLLRHSAARGTPTVMVTSTSNPAKLLELARLGAARVIRKPFDPQTLHRALAPLLGLAPPDAPTPLGLDPGGGRPPSDALNEAVVSALAQMTFIAASRADDRPPPERLLFASELAFEGGATGSLWIGATLEVATELALNFTGEAPGGDDRARLDAISELTNIIAGEFLHELAGGDRIAFGLPAAHLVEPAGCVDRAVEAYGIDLGLGRLYTHLRFQLTEG